MIIKSKTSVVQNVVIGRLSDGSDRQEVAITTYTVKVEDQDRFYILTFDHDPTTEEIETAFAAGLGEEVATIEDLSDKLAETRVALRVAEETEANYLIDLDFRLSLIELGL